MADEKCKHLNFRADVAVNRILAEDDPEKVLYFACDVKIHCTDCGQPLEFQGLPRGVSPYRATVSFDGTEVRLPAVSPGEKIAPGLVEVGVVAFPVTDEELAKH